MSSYRDRKRKPIAEINVVPYIDVMLVLLIIFMVTAPLLTEGVKIDLPQTDGSPVEANSEAPEPVILTVDASGQLFIDDQAKSSEEVLRYARAVHSLKPKTDFLVRGAKQAIYDDIIKAMVLLKQAGVETVSLVTEPIPDKK
ncbi:protein TolR [Arenicella xantha]|uniref:Tol-Pal system protein TolR n=1 Tax=Arenicella xantha TaxID=644221 RepID=A0A395JNK2_9GAMM|nr:protein TolR [Arenicella xantha]RBP53221.1 cell division and transport-associated protein TolR [Arenicella xantha]